jgi:carbonic anhydrase/acetyltransferase-like protein (isoleucine patch superfamily)
MRSIDLQKAMMSSFEGHSPAIGRDVFIDPSVRLIGRVTLKDGASVWPGAVLRADDEEIVIGEKSAVLDLCLLESPHNHPVIVESGALISHKVCLHGARVLSGALVGIGAIVLDGAVIGEGALIGAGALVPPGMEVPAGTLMLGQPARPVRDVKSAERDNIASQLAELEQKARLHRKALFGF